MKDQRGCDCKENLVEAVRGCHMMVLESFFSADLVLNPLENNASNAELPSLAKTRLWRSEKQNEKTDGKQALETIFYLNNFTSHRATKS